jgi:hypothetical protein
MVANWSTGAAWREALFLLIPQTGAAAEASRINVLPPVRAASVTRL